MKNYDIAIERIINANNIAIYTHANVDGDAIGSAFAFYYFLKELGKNVDVFTKTTIPSQLQFLKIANLINKKSVSKYDLVIVTDCNTPEMANMYAPAIINAKYSIQFDHHKNNPSYAKINIVEPTSSATCEIVAKFLLSTNQTISTTVAKFLLTGIITDTGGFKFSCTSSDTMQIVYALLNSSKLDISYLMSNIFESEDDENYLKLYKEAINNTQLLNNNKIALIKIDNSFYKNNGIDPNTAKNLTRIGTELKSVVVTALIAEVEPNVCKVSFRSRKGYDCSKCAMVFGGGGHTQASGCKIFGNINETVERVLKSITDGFDL